jgi:hypothetical protein
MFLKKSGQILIVALKFAPEVDGDKNGPFFSKLFAIYFSQ